MNAMKTNGQDILTTHTELRDNPFTVPEGYFESFRSDMSELVAAKPQSLWKKAVPYMAVAAALTLLLAVGSILKDYSHATELFSQEELILFSDNLISTEIYDENISEQYAEAEIQEEDIIQYLIYIGADLESIEIEK